MQTKNRNMENHVKVVAVLYLVLSILGLIAAFAIYFVLNVVGQITDDQQASTILSIISNVITTVIVISAIPGIIGAWGLLKHKEWARILVIILSIINLLNFPFGTALGIYAIWALVQPESLALFNNAANQENGRA